MGSILELGSSPGGEQDNPLQYSCLEKSMDGGAWWATIHRVAKSRIGLKQLSMHRNMYKSLSCVVRRSVHQWGERLEACFLEQLNHRHIWVLFSSVAQSYLTLCDPMNRSTPGLPVYHQLPEFTQTHIHRVSDASSHLIFCRPFFLLPPIPPSIRIFFNESTLCMKWPKYWGFSFSISPSNEHPGESGVSKVIY